MYRFLDHPSEALVEVTAATEAEVLQDAATALFDLMTDLSTVERDLEFKISLSAPEPYLLLVDWLNRLILVHESERVFLSEFRVELKKNTEWLMIALARGERIRENHERRLHAKSATYGLLKWDKTEAGHRVQFVIDV